jgi:bidirectional [NiFe] hydrogenase diaphorase subunit
MMVKAKVKTFTIDGQLVNGKSNQTILEVARENGIDIPTLCNLDGLSNIGACRLCLVEVSGSKKLTPACTTKIKSDMEVVTNSPRLKEHREDIISLIFAERNHTCSICVSNGDCELQDMAKKLEVTHINFNYLYPQYDVDASHELFVSDPNRCILCSRCVRVCSEIEGANTWSIINRGIESKTATDMDRPWGESDSCTSCGKCVQVCPTGALYKKGATSSSVHKRKDFLPYLLKNRSDI